MKHVRTWILAAVVVTSAFAGSGALAAPPDDAAMEGFTAAASRACLGTTSMSNIACTLAGSARRCQTGDADGCELAGKFNLLSDLPGAARGSVVRPFLFRACSIAPGKCVAFADLADRRLNDRALADAFLRIHQRSAARSP